MITHRLKEQRGYIRTLSRPDINNYVYHTNPPGVLLIPPTVRMLRVPVSIFHASSRAGSFAVTLVSTTLVVDEVHRIHGQDRADNTLHAIQALHRKATTLVVTVKILKRAAHTQAVLGCSTHCISLP